MKEKVQKAALPAIAVAVGITLVTLVKGDGFSFINIGIYATVAFVVDFLFSYFFEKKKRK